MPNAVNAAKIEALLCEKYRELFAANHPDYLMAKRMHTPESLAAKMTVGFCEGTASNDGLGIKHACKVLGIKSTYAAIDKFLGVK